MRSLAPLSSILGQICLVHLPLSHPCLPPSTPHPSQAKVEWLARLRKATGEIKKPSAEKPKVLDRAYRFCLNPTCMHCQLAV